MSQSAVHEWMFLAEILHHSLGLVVKDASLSLLSSPAVRVSDTFFQPQFQMIMMDHPFCVATCITIASNAKMSCHSSLLDRGSSTAHEQATSQPLPWPPSHQPTCPMHNGGFHEFTCNLQIRLPLSTYFSCPLSMGCCVNMTHFQNDKYLE